MATGTVRSGLGTALKRGNGDGPPETFATIPKVTNLKGPPLAATMLDTTALDTTGGYKTMIPSLKDAGKVTFTVDFMPEDTTHQKMLGDFNANTLRNFELHWPDGATIWSFAAYISKWEPDVAPEKVLTAACELTLSGAPTLVTA